MLLKSIGNIARFEISLCFISKVKSLSFNFKSLLAVADRCEQNILIIAFKLSSVRDGPEGTDPKDGLEGVLVF